MSRITVSISTIAFALFLTSCASTDAAMSDQGTEPWQEARPVGEPVNCISLSRIRNTRVHDDRTIDFHMNGGQIYRNTLPHRCSGLGFEEAFSYETSLSQLCSTDIITVVRTGGGGISGPSCGLGQFQPIEFPEDE
jgi:uncharacterized protein DUF6491